MMTPQQKIQHLIILKTADFSEEDIGQFGVIDASNIEQRWQALFEDDHPWDAMEELRRGEADTGIKCESSRHYESKSVAAKYVDGSWVGWTYWYGGGKHGEPEAIDWMEDAYDLLVTEEEKVVTVRTFAKEAAE